MNDRQPGPPELRLPIDQLLKQWPAAAHALNERKMACVGCVFDKFHSLDRALEIYELEPAEFLDRMAVLVKQDRSTSHGPSSSEGETNA